MNEENTPKVTEDKKVNSNISMAIIAIVVIGVVVAGVYFFLSSQPSPSPTESGQETTQGGPGPGTPGDDNLSLIHISEPTRPY